MPVDERLAQESSVATAEKSAPSKSAVCLERLEAATCTILQSPEEIAFRSKPCGRGELEAGQVLGGRYKLLQKLGEGGMGIVWEAEQFEQVRRKVALKVIKSATGPRQTLIRFEAERQALALMDHPNIARVLDAGEAENGRPFFVMELVKGIPITRFCDEQRLTPRQRLALFIPVCQAVQHAHQKGIIHRDLKPSNILIAQCDGRAVPKVIDFGIAKATSQKLTEQTFCTEVGQIVGTLEYMAPEQAELNNNDVDTRSDVYALGVVLYELLTGSTPLTSQQLRNVGILEMLRIIRDEQPARPSTRISACITLPIIAAARQLEPRRLANQLSGDLDWIVMKCLAKERVRRYESASSLAQDIQRYLDNEPVEAGPPSAGYRLRKFVRRNRGAVLSGAAMLLVLVAGIIGTTFGLFEARSAEHDARRQQQRADREAANARIQESVALIHEGEAKKHADRAENNATALTAQLERTQHVLFTAQVAAVANLWNRDSAQALELLNDRDACPPAMRDFAWHFYHRLCTPEQPVFKCSPKGNTAIAFSPDRHWLAAAGADGAVRVWDFATQTPAFKVEHGPKVNAIVYTLDGKRLITGSSDKTIRVWDAASGRRIKQLATMSGRVESIALRPGGQWIAACSSQSNPSPGGAKGVYDKLINGEVMLLNLETGEQRKIKQASDRGFAQAAFSPDGKLLAVAGYNGWYQSLWDVESGEECARFAPSNTGWMHCAAFSPDGRLLASGSADRKVHVWDVPGRKELPAFLGHYSDVRCVSFSPDGQYLLSSAGGDARLWNVADRRQIMVVHGCAGRPSALTPDGKGFICERKDGDLIRVALPSEESRDVGNFPDGLFDLAFSPDGKKLAAVCKDKSVWLIDPAAGRKMKLGTFDRQSTCVAYSGDGSTIFMGTAVESADKSKSGQIARWNVEEQKFLDPWLGHPGAVNALAAHARLGLLASGSDDGAVKLWDVASGKELPFPIVGSGPIRALAFHPEAKLLAGHVGGRRDAKRLSGYAGGQLMLWDVAEQPPRLLWSKPHAGHRLQFSRHGELLAFADETSLKLVDPQHGEVCRVLRPATSAIENFAFSYDCRTMALGLRDNTVQLLNIWGNDLRATLRSHGRSVAALSFSSDGRWLATGSFPVENPGWVHGGEIKVWEATTPTEADDAW